MAQANVSHENPVSRSRNKDGNHSTSDGLSLSAVSWSAILAGATATAVLSLILFLLGSGLGLSSISPWARSGVSAGVFGLSVIVWITVTQVIASGMGGYIAGRLRIRWQGVDQDEIYFRDTAHGFLSWSIATLATVSLFVAVLGSIINGGLNAASSVTESAVNIAFDDDQSNGDTMDYFIDMLFRQGSDDASIPGSQSKTDVRHDTEERILITPEVKRIFINGSTSASLPSEDLTYLSQLVSEHTKLTQEEAATRVDEIYKNIQSKLQEAEVNAKQVAETTRKTSIYSTLWLFVSLLMGAFSASLAATWGGRCRDA